MRNYYNLHALQTNMADACEESSSDCSDSISGNNSSFYAESSSSEENLQCEEPFLIRKAKITQWGIEFILKAICETEVCQKDKAETGNRETGK